MKQLYSEMKKVLAILLIVLFVVSFIAVTASAHGGGHGGWGGGWGYGPGCMWVGGNNWLCPAYSGMPYTIQTTAPAASAPAAPSPNLAGVAIFPETSSTSINSSSK